MNKLQSNEDISPIKSQVTISSELRRLF